jgi:hypothetical protein
LGRWWALTVSSIASACSPNSAATWWISSTPGRSMPIQQNAGASPLWSARQPCSASTALSTESGAAARLPST